MLNIETDYFAFNSDPQSVRIEFFCDPDGHHNFNGTHARIWNYIDRSIMIVPRDSLGYAGAVTKNAGTITDAFN